MQRAGSSSWVSHRARLDPSYLSRRSAAPSNLFSISGQVAQRRRLLLKGLRGSGCSLTGLAPCFHSSRFVYWTYTEADIERLRHLEASEMLVEVRLLGPTGRSRFIPSADMVGSARDLPPTSAYQAERPKFASSISRHRNCDLLSVGCRFQAQAVVLASAPPPSKRERSSWMCQHGVLLTAHSSASTRRAQSMASIDIV